MRRMHLFEFEDQRWFPPLIRDYGTDFLQFISDVLDYYKNVVPLIKMGLEKSNTNTVIDLASGGGGGWKKLSERLIAYIPDLKIILTDYYPNITAFKTIQSDRKKYIEYEEKSIDALDVPLRLKGLRTQFLSFHHFRPDKAKKILQNAVDNNASIAIFEAQERNLAHIIKFIFLSPLSVLLATPFIRPFKWGRIILTYLIPVVPLFLLWDGLVSVCRTYSVNEMTKMTEEVKNGDMYNWEIGKQKNSMITVLYAIGYPKEQNKV